jgi:anaerobic selenocysteine-containing dehydrogenase
LRGHSNVQGMGSMGVAPMLKGPMAEAIEKELEITLPLPTEGGDTMWCMQEADKGNMKYAMCLGGNLAMANPNTTFSQKAMSKIDLVSYMSTKLNQGHFVGRGAETIIFPVLARDEESQITTQESMFNFVRRSSGGTPRHKGPRSEVDVLVSIAEKGIGTIEWSRYRDHSVVRELIAKCLRGFKTKKEHQIEGRTFHEPKFSTTTGKAQAHVIALHAPAEISSNQLRLMTIRSEGQFNTVVYEEEDVFRKQTRRDVVLMNEQDISAFGVQVDSFVTVAGPSGTLVVQVKAYPIAKGNCAMYYPEANILLSTKVDDESKTPFFKGEVVAIKKN